MFFSFSEAVLKDYMLRCSYVNICEQKKYIWILVAKKKLSQECIFSWRTCKTCKVSKDLFLFLSLGIHKVLSITIKMCSRSIDSLMGWKMSTTFRPVLEYPWEVQPWSQAAHWKLKVLPESSPQHISRIESLHRIAGEACSERSRRRNVRYW